MSKSKLGERLKQARVERGLTLELVSARLKRAGMKRSPRTVRRYEDGDTEPPIKLLGVLATMYGVSTDALISGRESAA